MIDKVCFVIMGFGKKTDYSIGKTLDLDKTYKNIIKPAAEKCGYKCVRADEIKQSTIIDKSMYGLLLCADLVIADISTYNPNAIYELGVRHGVRPFHTIILKDNDGVIPFDLSHSSIMSYRHLGDDIGVDEATRCVNELINLIGVIEKKKETDSPFYEYISSIQPPKISEQEIAEIIKELASEYESLFAIIEEAKILMKKDNFREAAEYWQKASEKIPMEAYYIQQQALCTYKSKYPSEIAALNKASIVLEKILSSDKTIKKDPETFGIAGAIYKNMYLCTNDKAMLDKAIEYYEIGYNSRKDYYNGENYALCLTYKESISTEEERIYCRVHAKKIRNDIVEILTKIIRLENISDRDDRRWIYATLANSYYALGNYENAKKFEDMFKSEEIQKWELDTYNKNKEELFKLMGGNINE